MEIWRNTGIYCEYENTGVYRYAFCVSTSKISYTPSFNISGKILCSFQNTGHEIFNIITEYRKIQLNAIA